MVNSVPPLRISGSARCAIMKVQQDTSIVVRKPSRDTSTTRPRVLWQNPTDVQLLGAPLQPKRVILPLYRLFWQNKPKWQCPMLELLAGSFKCLAHDDMRAFGEARLAAAI